MLRFLHPWRLTAVFILLLIAAKPAAAQNDYNNGGSYQQFYDELSPYGEWVDDRDYGYVWIPNAGNDFRPYYSNGYWANTEYGNTWVSNYKWGWAPFHYGRWTYSNYYGWAWIPGNVWGPAWVSWRSGGGAYGWAPLGPGISINFSFGNSYYVPDYWWTFAPQQYILSPGFHQHCYGPRYNTNYVHQTTIINNTYVYNNNTYVTGPRRNELERATGRPVKQLAIRNGGRPDGGQLRGNKLTIYRPTISESRPRTTERPRRFRVAEQPISNADNRVTAPADRNVLRQPAQDRSQVVPHDRSAVTTDRAVLNGNNVQQPRVVPGQDRISIPETERQPARPVEIRQPQQSQRDFSRLNEFPDRTPAPQPQQRIERVPNNRSIEAPRMQQVQAVPQQRMERPVIEQRNPMMQQRVESPRVQQMQAAPQQRMDRAVVEQQKPMMQQRVESPRVQQMQATPQQRMDRLGIQQQKTGMR